VATLAYRAQRALCEAPPEFGDFRSGSGTRTPVQILAHMGDLLDWALSMAEGKSVWRDSKAQPWSQESARWFGALKTFDEFLASEKPLEVPAERLFQGPIADALTHVGQIALLRRSAGSPIQGENYFLAEISAGRVGPDQAAAVRQFE
jgi:hypothetical protein